MMKLKPCPFCGAHKMDGHTAVQKKTRRVRGVKQKLRVLKMGKKLKCLKCNDIIESKHVHDFVNCKCGAIFIDGGDDYCRYGGWPEDFEWVEEEDLGAHIYKAQRMDDVTN